MFGLSAITEDVVPRMLSAACIVFGAVDHLYLFPSGPAQSEAAAGIRPVQDSDLLGRGWRRLVVSHWHRRDCASAAADVAIGIRAEPFAIGDADLCLGRGGLVHQRASSSCFLRLYGFRKMLLVNGVFASATVAGDRTVYGKNASLADFRRAVDYRMLPLAAVYRPERDHLCGDTGPSGQRRHQHVRHRAAALTGRGRNRGGLRVAGVELSFRAIPKSSPAISGRPFLSWGSSPRRRPTRFRSCLPRRERRWPDASQNRSWSRRRTRTRSKALGVDFICIGICSRPNC